MKKLLFLLAGIFLTFNSAHSQIKAQVDERFELTCIYFALAGVPEYCACAVPSYWADMNKTFFDDFTYSEPIHYARFLHQKHNIQYALVPWIAEKLEIVSGHVRLAPQWKVEELVAEVPHWGEGRLEKFIKMLETLTEKLWEPIPICFWRVNSCGKTSGSRLRFAFGASARAEKLRGTGSDLLLARQLGGKNCVSRFRFAFGASAAYVMGHFRR